MRTFSSLAVLVLAGLLSGCVQTGSFFGTTSTKAEDGMTVKLTPTRAFYSSKVTGMTFEVTATEPKILVTDFYASYKLGRKEQGALNVISMQTKGRVFRARLVPENLSSGELKHGTYFVNINFVHGVPSGTQRRGFGLLFEYADKPTPTPKPLAEDEPAVVKIRVVDAGGKAVSGATLNWTEMKLGMPADGPAGLKTLGRITATTGIDGVAKLQFRAGFLKLVSIQVGDTEKNLDKVVTERLDIMDYTKTEDTNFVVWRGRNPDYTAILKPSAPPKVAATQIIAPPAVAHGEGNGAGQGEGPLIGQANEQASLRPGPTPTPAARADVESPPRIFVTVRHLDHEKPFSYQLQAPGMPAITLQRFEITEPEKFKGRTFSIKILSGYEAPLQTSEYFHLKIPRSFVEEVDGGADGNYWNFAALVIDESVIMYQATEPMTAKGP